MGQKIGLLQWFFSLWQLWGTGQLKNRRLSVCHWCVRWDWVESMSYHPRRWWFSLQRRLWIFHNKAGQCTKWHWYEKLATPRQSTWWLHWFAWLCHHWFGRRGSFWTRGAHATLLLTFWCQQVSGHHCYPRPRQIPKWLLWFSHLVESIWLPEHTAGPSCGWVFALFSAPWYIKWWLSYDSDQQWQDELSLERSQYWQWWWIYSLVQRLIHRCGVPNKDITPQAHCNSSAILGNRKTCATPTFTPLAVHFWSTPSLLGHLPMLIVSILTGHLSPRYISVL